MVSKWNKESPSCSRCSLFKPSVYGWRCHALSNGKKQPEVILDTEAGNCGMFMYSSSRLKENQ